jgi:hypothetical protein
MMRGKGKQPEGAEFVAGFKEAAGWGEPTLRQPKMELPLPDYAPFAVPSDEVWRELQRRRNLVRLVEALAQSARDEGFPLSGQILGETAGKLRAALILAGASRQAPEPQRPPCGKARRALNAVATVSSAPARRRKKKAPAPLQLPLMEDPEQVEVGTARMSTKDALAALEQVASSMGRDVQEATGAPAGSAPKRSTPTR